MKEKILINDDRLTPTMERIRNGKTQLFRERNPNDRTFISSEKCDVALTHEDKSMFAELIDGQWYWVSGCAECNGEPRDWMSYVECELHDRCRECNTNRKDIKETPWGGKRGWICKPCNDAYNLLKRLEAFEKYNEVKDDSYFFLYTDDIKCPHCASTISSDDVYDDQILDCSVCDGSLNVEISISRSFSTSIHGKRVTE